MTSTIQAKISDPVNTKNNATKIYTSANAEAIVDTAIETDVAIDAELAATTIGDSVYYC